MAVCAKCGFEYPSGARYCPGCAAPLASQDGGSRQSRRVVTSLFCDVTDSVALGERLDPEVLRGILDRYFEALREVIEHHGGTVEKFAGDAVMAVFGIHAALWTIVGSSLRQRLTPAHLLGRVSSANLFISAGGNFAGALLVVTFAYYPLVYLPVAAALRGLDPALEETARALGVSAWGCFVRVTLPQLRPALLGGVLLVALDTLTEFGAFALLRFRTFTTELYAQYRIGLDGPETSLLALVLVGLCLALLVAELRVHGRARYARVGAGTKRAGVPMRLGRMRGPVLCLLSALVLATLGVPVGMVVY